MGRRLVESGDQMHTGYCALPGVGRGGGRGNKHGGNIGAATRSSAATAYRLADMLRCEGTHPIAALVSGELDAVSLALIQIGERVLVQPLRRRCRGLQLANDPATVVSRVCSRRDRGTSPRCIAWRCCPGHGVSKRRRVRKERLQKVAAETQKSMEQRM